MTRSRCSSPRPRRSAAGRTARSRTPRRSTLREDLRPDQGLGVRLRQVQAHQEQGHGLRPLRRRGDARVGPPPAHGPHRARGPREPHLVLQVQPVQDGAPPRQDDERARARPLLSGLDGHRTRRHRPQGRADPQRPGVHRRAGEVRRRLQGRDGRRSGQDSRSRWRTPAPSRTARRSPSA